MDRKSIIVLVICFLLLLSLPLLSNKVFPPKPLPPGATNAPVISLAGTTNPPGTPAISTGAPPVLESAPRTAVANTNIPEQLLEITNTAAHYTFSSHGGGLKLVELLQYPESVATRRQRQQRSNRVATLNTVTPAPTLALLDGPAIQGDGVFNLTRTPNGVRAEQALTNGLVIIKDFELSTNYLLFASVRLENRSETALALPPQEWFVGTATPMNAQDDGSAVGVMWYNGAKSTDVGAGNFSGGFLSCVIPRAPPTEYRGTNVLWAVAHNQFFALATMPQDAAGQIIVHRVNLPQPEAEEVTYRTVRQPVGYEATLLYPGTNLAPHQAFVRKVALFAGPKEYRTLATISSALGNNIDLIMGYSGFFGFFSKGLLLWMNWLHSVLGIPYGWVIIVITVLIKIVFWPLTQASTRSAKRMQALQPQIKALQEKYKDDPVKAQRKMMEFWKEHKVNPMSGCLPTLIQMPVFFGFYYMIRSAIELRGASFLWVGDLSRPDTLFIIPGVNFPFNLLPLIMGVTMLYQARLTPPSPGMDPTQAKMMRYMPLMFMVFLYNFSAGLTLYWTVQNILSIVQTKLTRTIPEPAAPAGPPRGPVLTSPPKKRK